MSTHRGDIPALKLDLTGGPALASPLNLSGESLTIGRALDSTIVLPHETVSRRHAILTCRARQWFLTDLGSRHGTQLNGVTLAPQHPSVVEHDDVIALGPWTFRVSLGNERTRTATSLIVSTTTLQPGAHRVERVPERELAWTAQQRLDLLIRASAAINGAPSEQELQRVALNAACAGCGYSRAAWLRPLQAPGAEPLVEVVASQAPANEPASRFAFSQSLINEASSGQLVRLTEDAAPANYGQSIVSLGIHSALCAPVMLGTAIVGFLYLDARGQEAPVQTHAAAFCQALAQICGLALANIRREDLERRQRRLEGELSAAREAQQLIMPPASGTLARMRYAMRNTPGRSVAGDLFDVVPLGDERVAFCIGDVAGKSIGAALLMATTQSYLHAALARYQDAARALMALNAYLAGRCAMDRFVTMWVGIVDARNGSIVYVDAGHGHWLLKRKGENTTRIDAGGGIPIAIDPDYQYVGEQLTLAPGDRLILYSDGISEQRSTQGEEFTRKRVEQTLVGSGSPQEDVDRLFQAVQDFASTTSWDDDATAAAIELLPEV
jgi:serine phosphatase RsbU (regulator of sigma subunit)/pSer/pThr/pTyr-binding forkhead associated (FHA) protein